jgi:hypothetical protein
VHDGQGNGSLATADFALADALVAAFSEGFVGV